MKEAADLGVQISVVVGGGNVFKGRVGAGQSMDQATADYMGMLATSDERTRPERRWKVWAQKPACSPALAMQQIAETYTRPKAIQYLEEGKIVIFAAGTGNRFHYRHCRRPAVRK